MGAEAFIGGWAIVEVCRCEEGTKPLLSLETSWGSGSDMPGKKPRAGGVAGVIDLLIMALSEPLIFPAELRESEVWARYCE